MRGKMGLPATTTEPPPPTASTTAARAMTRPGEASPAEPPPKVVATTPPPQRRQRAPHQYRRRASNRRVFGTPSSRRIRAAALDRRSAMASQDSLVPLASVALDEQEVAGTLEDPASVLLREPDSARGLCRRRRARGNTSWTPAPGELLSPSATVWIARLACFEATESCAARNRCVHFRVKKE
jgi:hypothetical protein